MGVMHRRQNPLEFTGFKFSLFMHSITIMVCSLIFVLLRRKKYVKCGFQLPLLYLLEILSHK
jgi:hypothetical protein